MNQSTGLKKAKTKWYNNANLADFKIAALVLLPVFAVLYQPILIVRFWPKTITVTISASNVGFDYKFPIPLRG